MRGNPYGNKGLALARSIILSTLETICQAELNQPRAHTRVTVVLRCDAAKGGIVHVLIREIKIGVIEDIEEIGLPTQCLAFANS